MKKEYLRFCPKEEHSLYVLKVALPVVVFRIHPAAVTLSVPSANFEIEPLCHPRAMSHVRLECLGKLSATVLRFSALQGVTSVNTHAPRRAGGLDTPPTRNVPVSFKNFEEPGLHVLISLILGVAPWGGLFNDTHAPLPIEGCDTTPLLPAPCKKSPVSHGRPPGLSSSLCLFNRLFASLSDRKYVTRVPRRVMAPAQR